MDFTQCQFLTSANLVKQFPHDTGAEVAFAGRSNAGKSSALNALTGRTGLARVSKTPGRTQLVNFFRLTDEARLVDLPGYGYAEVPQDMRRHWGDVIHSYLRDRQALRGIVILMDIRHPLGKLDQQLLDAAAAMRRPCHVLLTKADKLGRGAAANSLQTVRKNLPEGTTVQLFSAPKKQGLEELRTHLSHWLTPPDAEDAAHIAE